MTKFQKFIIFLPLLFGLLCSILIFVYTNIALWQLTSEARQVLHGYEGDFLTSTLLLLIPNSILSLLMIAYIRSHPMEETNPLILCISSLAAGTLISGYIWAFYNFGFQDDVSRIPVVMYGFPFTFFFGICIGWVIGYFIISSRR